MNPVLETRAYGKWILAGEHAVLRGSPALVFPVFAKSLSVRYFDDGQALSAEFGGERGEELQLLFWGVMEKALELIGHSRSELTGRFLLENSVPVGAGLGASATLCVGVGRWFAWKGWVQESELYEFSRQLENLFHGESSGVDIAVALSGQGLHFERNGERYPIEPAWQPYWYLSYSGKRGVTSECVARVKGLWELDPEAGRRIDAEMKASVLEAEEALRQPTADKGLPILVAAIERAAICFESWGLAGGEIGRHMQQLREAGAVAVKPTGSGDGGYVLSVWPGEPPVALIDRLIFLGR